MIDLYLYFAKRTILAQLNLDLLSSFSTAGNAFLRQHFNSYYSYLQYPVTPRVAGVFSTPFEASQSNSIPQTYAEYLLMCQAQD